MTGAFSGACDEGKSSWMVLERLASLMGSGNAVGLCLALALVPEAGAAGSGHKAARWHWQLSLSCSPLHPHPLGVSLCPAMSACFCFPWRARLLPTPGLHSRTFLPPYTWLALTQLSEQLKHHLF